MKLCLILLSACLMSAAEARVFIWKVSSFDGMIKMGPELKPHGALVRLWCQDLMHTKEDRQVASIRAAANDLHHLVVPTLLLRNLNPFWTPRHCGLTLELKVLVPGQKTPLKGVFALASTDAHEAYTERIFILDSVLGEKLSWKVLNPLTITFDGDKKLNAHR